MDQIDLNFTNSLRRWLEDENRDYARGALLLFRLRGNQIEFSKLSRNPDSYRKYIFDNIKKFHDFRTAGITHDQVMKKVEVADTVAKKVVKESSIETGDEMKGERSGRRSDHDSLPEDIRRLYEDNRDIFLRIAGLHSKLKMIIASNAECKDADLLPFAEEIIRLDKIRLANWKKYDSFKLNQA